MEIQQQLYNLYKVTVEIKNIYLSVYTLNIIIADAAEIIPPTIKKTYT